MTAAQDDKQHSLTQAAARAFRRPFGAIVKISPEGDAPFAIDGRKNPPAIVKDAPADDAADIVLRGARDVLLRVLSAERALESAYIAGRLQISGDMSVMARLTLDETG